MLNLICGYFTVFIRNFTRKWNYKTSIRLFLWTIIWTTQTKSLMKITLAEDYWWWIEKQLISTKYSKVQTKLLRQWFRVERFIYGSKYFVITTQQFIAFLICLMLSDLFKKETGLKAFKCKIDYTSLLWHGGWMHIFFNRLQLCNFYVRWTLNLSEKRKKC